MPELPEVETSVQAIQKFKNQTIESIEIFNPNLRWKVNTQDFQKLHGKKVLNISRRAKYIMLNFGEFEILIHLGMTGTLRITDKYSNLYKKHDHIELIFETEKIIFNDPRRFGYIDLTNEDPDEHKFLSFLGPEPLSNSFNADNLAKKLLNKEKAIKNALLDHNIISGLGNIYVCEALFRARINPKSNCSKFVGVSGKPKKPLITLVSKINQIIKEAINVGGSTLKDFSNISGKMGYFQSSFNVYGRDKQNCKRSSCSGIINKITQSNRSTFLCEICQK